MKTLSLPLMLACALAAIAGCGEKPLHFPSASLAEAARDANAQQAFDTNDDGRADYFTFADANGRVARIGYATGPTTQPSEVIDLAGIDARTCRHVVIILDGIGYPVVKDFFDAGHLRMFPPPSKVVAPYPTLTDLCIEDALGYIPCRAFEAQYFDRHRNQVIGGAGAYMAGNNEPYNRILDYRASLIWDAIGYLQPQAVFGKELNDFVRLYRRDDRRELYAYFVSSAGIGTARGAAGQREVLEQVERLVNQLAWSSRGLTRFTILADHGHSYTPSRRLDLEGYLTSRGWRLRDSLKGPRDVAYIRFGLETYAAFSTQSPPQLATDLAVCDGVTLASYADGNAVVVLGKDGSRATVRRSGDRYKYEVQKGDPLELAGTLTSLHADANGYLAGDELLAATVDAQYPDALARLWRAHFGLAENVPDVIVSLEDRFYSGSNSFAGTVNIASTHGGLNRANSVTFIMSTFGPLPPFMRSGDIPRNMTTLTGRPWAPHK